MTRTMTHEEAVAQHAVEQYLLGELTAGSRDRFEDHLFDCAECTADLKSGVLFLDTARTEFDAGPVARPAPAVVRKPAADTAADTAAKPEASVAVRSPVHPSLPALAAPHPRRSNLIAWPWSPGLLTAALAACLMVVVYQYGILIPRLQDQLARLDQPTLAHPLILANPGARGDTLPTIVAPRNGAYLLSVDLPPSPTATAFRCSLVSPSGTILWHLDVPAAQAHDAILLQVPARAAEEGVQQLRIAALSSESLTANRPADAKLDLLATYRYRLTFAK